MSLYFAPGATKLGTALPTTTSIPSSFIRSPSHTTPLSAIECCFNMRIKVPDDDEVFAKDDSAMSNQPAEQKPTIQDEMKMILELPKPLSSFILDGDTPETRHQMLLNFTQYCRGEIFPRHVKAIELIKSRSDGLQAQLLSHQKNLAGMMSLREELQQKLKKLDERHVLSQAKQEAITNRLKSTLAKLQDCCKNKTVGEEKTAQDLKDIKEKVDSLKHLLEESRSRSLYYSAQVKAQSDSARKHIKPLYLDKNRTVFLRSNLNTMRQNLEDLIQRLKLLKIQTSDLSDANVK